MRKLFGHFGKKKLKKVSFDEQRLKTFVYDKDTIDGSSEILHIKSPFTELDFNARFDIKNQTCHVRIIDD
uniref:Bm1629, isoform b n=1 Tax=Brugia malayi TaxID=6279 RepID=A0A1I9G686_BRUMA|nr:Bm1629, isoform b [Brugia malayi]